MGFKKLRIAPITNLLGAGGYPEYGPFVKLQDTSASVELNSVEITINAITKSKTLAADDREEEKVVDVRYEGTLKVFECNVDAAAVMFGNTKDKNSNEIEKMNASTKKSFGVFFEGETSNGKKFQKYLYNVKFGTPNRVNTTDSGEGTATLEIPFKGEDLIVAGEQIRSATVYLGNTGWVANEPTTMYKEVAE